MITGRHRQRDLVELPTGLRTRRENRSSDGRVEIDAVLSLLKKVPGPFSASFLFFTRNNRRIMPQIIPESKIYFVTYRGEMCEFSKILSMPSPETPEDRVFCIALLYPP
jgi:hypothetical protein